MGILVELALEGRQRDVAELQVGADLPARHLGGDVGAAERDRRDAARIARARRRSSRRRSAKGGVVACSGMVRPLWVKASMSPLACGMNLTSISCETCCVARSRWFSRSAVLPPAAFTAMIWFERSPTVASCVLSWRHLADERVLRALPLGLVGRGQAVDAAREALRRGNDLQLRGLVRGIARQRRERALQRGLQAREVVALPRRAERGVDGGERGRSSPAGRPPCRPGPRARHRARHRPGAARRRPPRPSAGRPRTCWSAAPTSTA